MKNPYNMSNLAQMPQQSGQMPGLPQQSMGIDPLISAGYSIIKGTPIGEAMMQAAQIQQAQHQQQLSRFDAEQKQRKIMQQELMMQSLPDALKNLDVSNPGAAISMLVQQGLDPREATSIVSNLADNQLRKQELARKAAGNGLANNFFTGANNLRYQTVINPETGQPEARVLPGQINQNLNGRKLTPAELRLNKANLQKLDGSAKASAEQLKQLDTLEKAYDQFDQYAEPNSYKGSGSLISNILPSDEDSGFTKAAGNITENFLYKPEARSAAQTIKKVNSLLLQQRIAEKKGEGPVTDVLKKSIKQGLPNINMLPEARRENISSLKREAAKNILQQRFFSTWSKLNNMDTDQAGTAFTDFIQNNQPIDEKGNLNKDLLNNIDKYVEEYVNDGSDQGFEQYFR